MTTLHFPIKNKRTTLERGEKFISSKYYADENLYSRLIKERFPFTTLEHYQPPTPGRVTYSEAISGSYAPAKIGDSFGPTWSTHWFRASLVLPQRWIGEHVVVEWDSNSEAMVWKDGAPVQGLSTSSKRNTFLISDKLQENQVQVELYIEMACNEVLGAGDNSLIAPPKLDRSYTLSLAGAAVLNPEAYQLYYDIQVLHSFAEEMDSNNPRSWDALYTMNKIINTVDIDDAKSLNTCHDLATRYFSQPNSAGQMTMYAVANCHIDTAWLWPYAETIRKCARSFSAVVRLLDTYPDLLFVCSQAQQFAWVKEHYPTLYNEMGDYVSAGRFIPVGGTWVEMDGLLPSGEGFIRQFLYGQKFFKSEYGKYCTEFWLPDTFGYSGQLPQIMRHCGITRFVTQKMSWSLVNKFPHHTFWWVGIDGSRVLSHFPPGDCYTMDGQYKEVKHSATNFQDKGRSNRALYLYGTGDGGQGPTAEMIERLHRMKDSDGCPRVKFASPSEFFDGIETKEGEKLCDWRGELYLELHNATYTSQAKTKQGNRQGELLLQDVESLSVLASLTSSYQYPTTEITKQWQSLLLNQFHDVLPGTSIEMVYEDVAKIYQDIKDSALKMRDDALSFLLKLKSGKTSARSAVCAVNTCSWPRKEVVCVGDNAGSVPLPADVHVQADTQGNQLALVDVPSFGFGAVNSGRPIEYTPVTSQVADGCIILQNAHLSVTLDNACRVIMMRHVKDTSSTGIIDAQKPASSRANQLVLYDDVPLYWDAWDVMDYHLETRKPVDTVTSNATLTQCGPLRAVVQCTIQISQRSEVVLSAILDADCPYVRFDAKVEWHESHKFLKVEFPVNALVNEATYEIQSGHITRPTHRNTSWDWARYEVCGHKWADVSEYNRGLAVLNDSKYGWSCFGSTLYLSLLRSPKSPDANADMGTHSFSYAMMPHVGTLQESGVIQAAYQLNKPLLVTQTAYTDSSRSTDTGYVSYLHLNNDAVIMQAFKQAEDDVSSNACVLRLYEAYGGSASCDVTINLPFTKATICNGLEEHEQDQSALTNVRLTHNSTAESAAQAITFSLVFKPFQIHSVLLYV